MLKIGKTLFIFFLLHFILRKFNVANCLNSVN